MPSERILHSDPLSHAGPLMDGLPSNADAVGDLLQREPVIAQRLHDGEPSLAQFPSRRIGLLDGVPQLNQGLPEVASHGCQYGADKGGTSTVSSLHESFTCALFAGGIVSLHVGDDGARLVGVDG